VDLRPVRNLDKLIGERFEFKILKFNQKRGNIVLSRRALLEVDREERRKKTLAILKEGVLIKGFVKNVTDYGAFIDLGGVDGLLHITDMTWGRIVHPSEMFNIGDEVEVMVLKFDPQEEKVSLGLKQKFPNPWDSVKGKYPQGTRVTGKIVSLTDYGAFIELEPGVEGLIHVSEMSWTRKVRHPSKLLTLGQMVEAVVKDLDIDRKRISLSIKEAEPNPWETIHLKYPIGSVVTGKVRNITDFGIFVGLEDGIDGLVHVSDLSWSQRQRKPSAFAKKGDDIQVKILHIDPEKERLSLGIKQLTEDPWKNLEDKVHINDEVEGRVVNVTDFGVFVEVMEGVEGLVHISEIDADVPKDKLDQFYRVGSLIRAKVLKVDVDERRLGLGILGIIEQAPEPAEGDVLKGALAAEGETQERKPKKEKDESGSQPMDS
jgi:small subunit ribosomal protein S1